MKGTSQSHALEARSISKSFGGVHAVSAVDLTVSVGERRALIGPNGAGKTTLFNLVAGELLPDNGTIKLFEHDITSYGVHRRARLGLGRTYQISELMLGLTVEQNLFLAGSVNTRAEYSFFRDWLGFNSVREWVKDVAGQVGLANYRSCVVSELSYGMQRQLEVGMALAMNPKIIMLDEPAAGLSSSEREGLVSLMRDLPSDVTIVLIEHDIDLVLSVAERIDVLYRGEVIVSDVPERIRSNQQVQKVYLGTSYAG